MARRFPPSIIAVAPKPCERARAACERAAYETQRVRRAIVWLSALAVLVPALGPGLGSGLTTASVAQAQEPQAAGQTVHGNANRGARIRAENERPGTTSWQSDELRQTAEERRQRGPERRDPHDERDRGAPRGAPSFGTQSDTAPTSPAPLIPPPFGAQTEPGTAKLDSGGVAGAPLQAETWRDTPIRGFADATSINMRQSLHLRIGTTRPRYKLEVYRMGWYNGTGGRLMHSVASLTGQNQAVPTPQSGTGLIVANWQVSYTLQTAADWVSGMYP